MSLRLRDLNVAHHQLGWQKRIIRSSSITTRLRLDNEEHGIAHFLVAGRYHRAIDILRDAGRVPYGLECMEVGINIVVGGIASATNAKIGVRNVKLAPT